MSDDHWVLLDLGLWDKFRVLGLGSQGLLNNPSNRAGAPPMPPELEC